MSKLKDFLDSNKIDPRRILVASRKLERLTPADREVRLARRQARDEKATDAVKEKAKGESRSGKPVSPSLLESALGGGKLSRHAKNRILRAVNHVLEQKKKGAVGAGDLF